MSISRKILFAFEQPTALRELIHAASSGGLELLPVRGRKNALSALQDSSDARAIIVEHSAQADFAALEILENARALRPKLRRVILMDSPDLTRIVNALHSGSIESILYQPVDAKQFLAAVTDGVAGFAPPSPPTGKDAPAPARRR